MTSASLTAGFAPECLTIGLGKECNLDCSYCYAKVRPGQVTPSLGGAEFLAAIRAGAELVARTCQEQGRRLSFGFQGAGEPFLDFDRLAAADEAVRAIAASHGLPVFSYITSNGTMGEDPYRWAAQRFDRICLSVDGPPRLHDRARRFRNGAPTSGKVRDTVELLKALGKPPACRVTVTRENVDGMVEMARFLLVELGLTDVQFEPVYSHPDQYPDPEKFAQGLVGARGLARRCGGVAFYSGYRPGETHGPYCQTSRHVLFVTGNGTASACLFHECETSDSPFFVGAHSPKDNVFAIAQQRIDEIEAAVARLPEACQDCAVRDHCVRGCPDFCPLDIACKERDVTQTLRCRINRLLRAAELGRGQASSTAHAGASGRGELPEELLAAQRELRGQKNVVPNSGQHLAAWEGFVHDLRSRVPSAQMADEGATIYLGKLSPGCGHCKRGTWDCIFVTKQCNLACSFCCSANTIPRKGFASALGKSVDQLIENYQIVGIGGISLSGGEALLEPEQTFSLLEAFRRRLPSTYLWLYTNGLLLQPEYIERLADLGLDEIRFNAAATGYDDPIVLQTMARAAQRIPAVTVEIPAIPSDAHKLVACLAAWCDAGVTYVNLHELMRERNSHSACLQGDFRQVVLADGHATDVSVGSREVALQVMQTVVDRNIPLNVNLCSFANKLLQLRGRRRNLAVLRAEPHQRLVDSEYLDTVLACTSAEDYQFVHPDEIARLRNDGRARRLFLIRRTAPLSLDDPGRLVQVEEVT
jgi:pyruvate formate-lyase activating enzyme-like uncharacterized protein